MRKLPATLLLFSILLLIGSCCTTPDPIVVAGIPEYPELPERPDPPEELTDEELDFLVSLADTILVLQGHVEELTIWAERAKNTIDAHNEGL